tara:strand:+ start:286 stop:474 length:189 start_codon:yes stop_codon:yes gene_type:complete
MNEATAKRWIADLPISSSEREKALEWIKGKSESSIIRYLFHLREKSGGRYYMNKKANQLAVK